MSDVEERLRELVQVADPDGTVTVRWIADLLGETMGDTTSQPQDARPRDLTVDEVAEHFGRAPSTVRGWLGRGEMRGYKLNRRDWRIPPTAVKEYERQQQRSEVAPGGEDIDISEWRRVVS